jgi:hypothetical protein
LRPRRSSSSRCVGRGGHGAGGNSGICSETHPLPSCAPWLWPAPRCALCCSWCPGCIAAQVRAGLMAKAREQHIQRNDDGFKPQKTPSGTHRLTRSSRQRRRRGPRRRQKRRRARGRRRPRRSARPRRQRTSFRGACAGLQHLRQAFGSKCYLIASQHAAALSGWAGGSGR